MSNTPTKVYSSKQENSVAKYLGWEVVSGSGARNFHPGDLISDTYLGECKTHTTQQDKIVFMRDVWTKISYEATSKMKTPILIVDDGSQKIENTWCLIEERAIPKHIVECDSLYAHVFMPNLDVKVNLNLSIDALNNVFKFYGNDRTYMSVQWHKKDYAVIPLINFKNILDAVSQAD